MRVVRMMRRRKTGFLVGVFMLLEACAASPAAGPQTTAQSAKRKAPSASKRVALLAPINVQGVPEPARSRSEKVLDEIHRVFVRKGRSVELPDFESFRAIEISNGHRDTPYDELVISKIVITEHHSRGHPEWDGVSWQFPTSDFPDNQIIDRSNMIATVMSLVVEIRGSDGEMIYEGVGGLDHLNHLRNLEGNRFSIETWPKTLERKNRIKKAVELALKPYLGKRKKKR